MTIKSTLQMIPGVSKTPESVDNILAVFTTTVTKLKAAQEHQAGLARTAEAEAKAAAERATAAVAEAARAATAIKKIESFLV